MSPRRAQLRATVNPGLEDVDRKTHRCHIRHERKHHSAKNPIPA